MKTLLYLSLIALPTYIYGCGVDTQYNAPCNPDPTSPSGFVVEPVCGGAVKPRCSDHETEVCLDAMGNRSNRGTLWCQDPAVEGEHYSPPYCPEP